MCQSRSISMSLVSKASAYWARPIASSHLRTLLMLRAAPERLGLFQVERVEALREPGVDRREHIAGFGALALIAPQPRHAHRRAQLPGLCLLRTGDSERAIET